jgi:hypothetical protein
MRNATRDGGGICSCTLFPALQAAVHCLEASDRPCNSNCRCLVFGRVECVGLSGGSLVRKYAGVCQLSGLPQVC